MYKQKNSKLNVEKGSQSSISGQWYQDNLILQMAILVTQIWLA
jgi:hypothetical protein